MLRLVLNLPTASVRDAKMGDILEYFSCRSVSFLQNGRDCGQRLKTEDLGARSECGADFHCPKTGAGNVQSVTSSADDLRNSDLIALVRVDGWQVLGNGENAGFAFEKDSVG